MRWQPLPIVGGSYRDDTRPWSVQDTINLIPVQAEQGGTRTPSLLRCAPGFSLFSTGAQSAPCRGLHNVEGTLYGVVGDKLYTWGLDGTATALGSIPGVERVSMAHNQIAGGNQIAIAANNTGYVYDTVAGTLTQITDDGFPGSIQFGYLAQSILGIDPSRNFAFWSAIADAASYNTLDRVQAEAAPDKLVGMAVTHSEWWLFGERTVQPFYINTSASAQGDAFLPMTNTVIEVGCASRDSIINMDNSVFWLGNDGIVYRANGYQPQRISTHAIEQAIAKCNRTAAFAFTFEDRGHKVYYLSFADGETWGYDAASGEWHRRQSYGMRRWRINALTRWRERWVGGDYANGKLYELNWDVQDEAGVEFERRRVTGVISDAQNPLIVNGVALVIDTGVLTQPQLLLSPLSLSGALPEGAVGESISYQYTVSGGVLPVSLSVASGALPTGLSMDASGLVTGTRTTAGSYAWTVRATDADGQFVDLAQTAAVNGTVIALLHFDADMTTDATGRVWTVNPWTEQIGFAPKLIWPQWDGSTYASGPGSFRMSRAGTAQSAEQGFYYGQARMYSALGTSGAIDSTTDFCVEGFVRRDPGDDNGGGSTMFLDFGIQLWARNTSPTTIPRSVSLEQIPAGMTVTYTGVDRTIPTDSFIHFALVRNGSTITLWWGGQAAATVPDAQLLALGPTFSVSLGTSQNAYAAWQMPGWLDEIRITKGWARYTQPFTPPSGV